MSNNQQKRPILRYHGGKWKLATWIISHFPKHTRYTESYCGAANILLKKQPAYAEVINDIDNEVVNLFRVIRNPVDLNPLRDAILNTPYSRAEFMKASEYVSFSDHILRAKNYLIRSHMGFNSAAKNTGFRSNSNRKCSIPAHNWADMPKVISDTAARLKGVVIENQDALKTMQNHDCPDTLHFIDSPYLLETRSRTSRYVHEMNRQDHINLLECIKSLKGMVVICGYYSELYREMLENQGWKSVKKNTQTAQKTRRTEYLWLNPHCQKRLALDQ